MLERRGLETVDRSFAACCRDDEVVLCAKADDIPGSEIGRNPVVSDSQVPEMANTKSLL